MGAGDQHDHDTSECCRELSRVWTALRMTSFNGMSASENVAAKLTELRSVCRSAEQWLDGICEPYDHPLRVALRAASLEEGQ